ncbi:phosphopentomutase [Heliobacterium gestii]|uniref:Phosphopentomutase n=1 Tax=Heliomicrobium gestii TaxID=2699 RepID=A0A845LA61_HELGE|nr:phosphopentomutase [Heliomicrobium gestii]MBM7865156.1 phosphopentomutase [Heliomicrobium gestii]MZP41425.1 phosphopentomutase [Heliomicrobium gestii]
MKKRVILIVLDSVGIGELPDADRYGDRGSHTLANIARAVGGLRLPNLAKLGLGNIDVIAGVSPAERPDGLFGKMAERAPGKDTTTGHWELAGVILDKPFPVYPDGFPPEVMETFEKAIGRSTLGNVAASGTEIIERLGEEHMATGAPIVYTSADSVFQIAAHEEVIPLEELYRYCQIARDILRGDHAVGRVIARPFVGVPTAFRRTTNRHDYSLKPPGRLVFDVIAEAGREVAAVGKIYDIYAGQAISRHVSTRSNMEGVDRTLDYMREVAQGLIMTNLVDFDMLYGHRNDPEGYARALEEFDGRLPEILAALQPEDLLLVTADHGCDPTTPSTDHSREYVPVLVTGQQIPSGIPLGIRSTFADLGETVLDWLELPTLGVGQAIAEVRHAGL